MELKLNISLLAVIFDVQIRQTFRNQFPSRHGITAQEPSKLTLTDLTLFKSLHGKKQETIWVRSIGFRAREKFRLRSNGLGRQS